MVEVFWRICKAESGGGRWRGWSPLAGWAGVRFQKFPRIVYGVDCAYVRFKTFVTANGDDHGLSLSFTTDRFPEGLYLSSFS